MNRIKLAFQEVASRITGISVPVFGISWNPPTSEREIVRGLLVFLEDRRALYNDFAHEIEHQVVESVQAIRRECTTILQKLPENSTGASSVLAIRAGCREYLDSVGPTATHHARFDSMAELGRLRAIVGIHVAYLAVEYGIDIEGELARVIPAELREARYLDDAR